METTQTNQPSNLSTMGVGKKQERLTFFNHVAIPTLSSASSPELVAMMLGNIQASSTFLNLSSSEESKDAYAELTELYKTSKQLRLKAANDGATDEDGIKSYVTNFVTNEVMPLIATIVGIVEGMRERGVAGDDGSDYLLYLVDKDGKPVSYEIEIGSKEGSDIETFIAKNIGAILKNSKNPNADARLAGLIEHYNTFLGTIGMSNASVCNYTKVTGQGKDKVETIIECNDAGKVAQFNLYQFSLSCRAFVIKDLVTSNPFSLPRGRQKKAEDTTVETPSS